MNAPAAGLLLQSKASQTELRALRGELNAARAEVTVAQSDLVAARTEEARKRELKAEESKTDKTLGEGVCNFVRSSRARATVMYRGALKYPARMHYLRAIG